MTGDWSCGPRSSHQSLVTSHATENLPVPVIAQLLRRLAELEPLQLAHLVVRDELAARHAHLPVADRLRAVLRIPVGGEAELRAELAVQARLLLDLAQRRLSPRLARLELALRAGPVVVAGAVARCATRPSSRSPRRPPPYVVHASALTSAPPGAKLHAPDLAVGRLGAQLARRARRSARQWHQNSTVGPAPEIVAPTRAELRARAPPAPSSADRGARGAAGGARSDSPRADQREVAASPGRARAATACADVVHRVGDRHLAPAAPRAPRPSAPARAGSPARPPARPAGRSAPASPSAADHEAAVAAPRRRCRGGPRARTRELEQRRVELVHVVGGARGRRRSPPRWSRGRPPAGSRTGSGSVTPSAGCSASKARTQRFDAVERDARRRRTRPRTRRSPPPRARGAATAPPPARRSPGPRLADEAGTRTSRRRFTRAPPPRRASMSGSQGTTGRRAVDRRLRVLQPVAGEHADDAALGAVLEQPGDRGRRRRLAEHALARAEQRVGVEDLVVGDRADLAARGR